MTQEMHVRASQILPDAPAVAPGQVVPLLIGATVQEIERELVLQTLARCDGNRTHAARVLGVSVRTLRNKIRQYSADGAEGPCTSLAMMLVQYYARRKPESARTGLPFDERVRSGYGSLTRNLIMTRPLVKTLAACAAHRHGLRLVGTCRGHAGAAPRLPQGRDEILPGVRPGREAHHGLHAEERQKAQSRSARRSSGRNAADPMHIPATLDQARSHPSP